jgi:hypothetical protein
MAERSRTARWQGHARLAPSDRGLDGQGPPGGRWIGGARRTGHPRPNQRGCWLRWWAVLLGQPRGGGWGPDGGGFCWQRLDGDSPLRLNFGRARRCVSVGVWQGLEVGGGAEDGLRWPEVEGRATGGDKDGARYFRAGLFGFPRCVCQGDTLPKMCLLLPIYLIISC